MANMSKHHFFLMFDQFFYFFFNLKNALCTYIYISIKKKCQAKICNSPTKKCIPKEKKFTSTTTIDIAQKLY